MYFYLSKILSPLINPTNFLFLALIPLFIIYNKTKKKLFYRLIILNIFLLFLISFLPLGNLGIKYLENNFSDKVEYEDIDNILVLSGSDFRIITSTKLAYKYPESKIFYLGGNSFLKKDEQNYELDIAKNFYKTLEFDISRVNFIGGSRNTIENFREIKKLNLDDTKTVLITSAYHMKRSLMIANSLNLNLKPLATDFRYFSQKSILNKYQSFSVVDNMYKFNVFFREILGIIAFKIFT